MEIKKLTKIQYDILIELVGHIDYCFAFRLWDDKYDKKTLSKEFKILREAGFVYFCRGLINEDGQACGSGYGIEYDKQDEAYKLIDDFEKQVKALNN